MSAPGNQDLLGSLRDSSQRVLAFLQNKLPELVLRSCSFLASSAFVNSCNCIFDREQRFLVRMAAINAIDISSSDDSDLREIDEYQDESPLRDSATSAVTSPKPNPTSRILPSWASQSSSSASGSNVRKAPSPKRSLFSDRNSAKVNSDVHSRPRMHSFSHDNNGASTSRTGYDDNYYEQLSSNQGQKRMLPPSFQPSGGRSNNLVQSVGGGTIRESYAKSHQSGWVSPANGKDHLKDHVGGPFMYDNKGNRVLPPSFVNGRYASAAPFVPSNDPSHPPALGEERAGGTDERIVYQAALQDLNQPKLEATLPDGLLSVSLLRHQKIALAWMLQKETTGNPCSGGILADDQGLGKTISMISLIQMQRSLNEKSKPKQCNMAAEALNLDDEDDGNGVAPDKGKQIVIYDDVKVVPEQSTSVPEFRSKRPAAGTLVVCPASILQQWAQELDEKVAEEAKLSVVVYHGSNRTKDPDVLAKYDVVLTTYTIVTKEVPKQPSVEEEDEDRNNGDTYGLSSEFSMNKKRKKAFVNKRGKKGRKGMDISGFESDCGALAKVRWSRVILDEAQTIKNHRTQVARACCSLRAKTRWCLSGTPIQNAIDELFSYFRFLKYDPYADYKSFCNAIKLSIARNSVTGYKKLQAILRATMLRRTKGTLIDGEPIISLPPKTINLERVGFTPEEWVFYKRLESDSRSQFKKYAEAGTLNQNYANILLMLLRLRQACDHPLLVKGSCSDAVGKISTGRAKDLPRETLIKLLKLLTSSAICCACDDPPEDAVVTMCTHVFCYQCVSDYLTGEDHTCPVPGCKGQLGAENVFTKATLVKSVTGHEDSDPSSSEFEVKSEVLQNKYSSSKIKAVLEILKSHHKTNSDLVIWDGNASSPGKGFQESQDERPIKTIIFSQWTTMLDLLEIALKKNGMKFRRLDGTMSLPARDKAVKIFNTNPEVTVMLMSLKAGNLGLNMVAACHVILLDLWWNPTTEDQAIDRAHRIGQTRPVTVSRLTIKDTVEDRILALQEEKRKMVASAFGEDHTGGSATRLTVEDLRYLFNI